MSIALSGSKAAGVDSMKKNVLVVDNNPVILKFMTNLLEKKGCQVQVAEDGLTALDVLESYVPDVIFVDLIMPNISGDKLCRIIRKMPELKGVYLVILSAISAEEEVDIVEFGANACIAKGPFNKMAQHILFVMGQSAQRAEDGLQGKILGIEDVNPRAITKELLSSKKHLEAILRNMSEGILELTLEQKIIYANPAAISLVGIPEDKLLASSFIELFSRNDREGIKSLLEFRSQSLKNITEDSPVILNGKEVSLDLMSFKDEERHSIVVIVGDVSERRRMQAQLQEAQKMEAIGTLAGGIAHDFNNLLMGIQGNVSLMLLDVDSTHPHKQRLITIEKLIQGGSKLTKQILGYAREGKYEVRAINLNQIVEETSETFGRAKKDITVHRDLAGDLLPVEADQGQIEQVLLSLYVNSWQAMPGGGNIFLKTMSTSDKDMKYKMYEPKPGNYVLFTITDTGTGMDKKTRGRIFDPFFTTRGMGRGTGLGLASVYGIIKGHGGYIDVDSEKGSGTTFSIYLPASEKQAAKREEPAEEVLKGTETVLFVDDEGMIIDVGREILKTLGYQVLLARGGKEAIEVYKANKDRIDMVILDMIMPDMGGGETYDLLKEINPQIKVLLSSGYSIEGQAQEIMERGCNGFIQKPFDVKQLSAKMRKILKKK
ncbi:MAG: response regulator [Desulfobulbaceae bacterium]|nr:response regulator [Desulfobulbaceae bacterium]